MNRAVALTVGLIEYLQFNAIWLRLYAVHDDSQQLGIAGGCHQMYRCISIVIHLLKVNSCLNQENGVLLLFLIDSIMKCRPIRVMIQWYFVF